ncbi:MAG TPA: hypothetical protein VK177_19750 [Flavobacteriales bacterium]|nr:hypothetical protein [Flavobacteriales bacterium]
MVSFKPQKGEIVFDVGFPGNHKHADVYYHLPDSTEYFYFGNTVTNKAINIFTFDNKLKWSIPLNEVLKNCDAIDNFGIIDPDTVLVLSQYSNLLFWVNSKGECYNKVWLDTVVINEKGDFFEFSSSIYQTFVVDRSTLFLAGAWKLNENYAPEKGSKDYLLSWFNKGMRKAAQVLQVKIKGTEIRGYTYGAYGLYDAIVTNNHSMVSDPPYMAFGGNKYFKTSVASDKIFEINPVDMKIIGKHQVLSDETKIGCSPYDCSPDLEGKKSGFSDWVATSMRITGNINRIMYDPFRKFYYVSVYYAVPKETPDEENGSIRDWSLLVYDTAFNKISETKFKGRQYSCGHQVVCRKGLLISTTFLDREDYDSKKTTFKLFKIES